MTLTETLAEWYRWRSDSSKRDAIDPHSVRMRAIDDIIESMSPLHGTLLRSMAAGRDLGAPTRHYIGEPPRDGDGLGQLEREALQQFARRLLHRGVPV